MPHKTLYLKPMKRIQAPIMLKLLKVKILSVAIGIIGLTSMATLTNGQELDFRTTFTDAEYYFLFNDFQEALPLYLRALDEKPNNANILYRIGRCYLNIPGIKHEAIPYLEKAVKNINPNYQEGSHREEGAPVNAYFYLGEAYRIAERFEEALNAYGKFKGMLETKNIYELDYVEQQIKGIDRAKAMKESPINFKLEPISVFDTDKYISCPAISNDGNWMLFTVQEKFYDAVYISYKNEQGNWEIPVNITLDLGVEGDLYTTSINHDGTEIFLIVIERGTGNIFHSKKVDGEWGKAQKLPRKINSRYWQTCATFTPDGQGMFFASNRRGGYGGLDIYFSRRLQSGEWADPVNLGPTINTPHNDEAPNLSPDGNTLYFISQGHNSIGGYDIFYSQRLDENEWSSPVNMGYPINTTDDDMSFFPLGNGNGMLSMVEQGRPNVRNLYKFNLISGDEITEVNITGELSLANNFEVEGKKFTISLIDDETKEVIQSTSPESITGKYTLKAAKGTYRIQAFGDGYASFSIPIYIPANYSMDEYLVNIRLVPERVSSGEYLAIRSILFEFDKSNLNREANFELEKLYSILNQYPGVTIEVTGHTDNIGSASYNNKLSQRRAQAAIDYLVKKGIDKDRLVARGASAFENVASNYNPDGSDNPAGRRLNRRVSIKVLKSDVDVTIIDEIDVPEHLKPREQYYTILLAPLNTNVNTNALNKLNTNSGLIAVKLEGTKSKFAYTIGSFAFKSNAIELLNFAIDNGFPKATIIGEDDLNRQLERTPTEIRKDIVDSDSFTIQVMTRAESITDKSLFMGLEVKEIKGNDGFFRYIYGEFPTRSAALEELENIKDKGFTEALVMSMNRYIE